MSELLKKAQQTCDERQKTINPEFKPRYHLSVPEGWLNDPNGFGYFQGRYHLYYQFHPYDSVWGPMHWGHWSSEDLITWTQEPVAMAPDRPFDAAGCFSGTGIEKDGKYYVMYTGVSEETPGGKCFQQQCLAVSEDAVRFCKEENNPVASKALLPEGASPYDFRDPKLEKLGDAYRMITASRGEDGGQLLSFVSEDLLTWRFEGVYADGLCEMTECPDCFELDGQRMVIVCLMGSKDETLANGQPVVYFAGKEEDGRFVMTTPARDVDRGLDFYAPQTCAAPDGRRILIGWAFAWGHVHPTHVLGHGWAGTMTLPRECVLKGDVLCQKPVREMESMRKAGGKLETLNVSERISLPECAGACREILMDVDMRGAETFTLHLLETEDEHFALTYDKKTGLLTADRGCCGYPLTQDGAPEAKPWASAKVDLADEVLSLRIYVDVSIVEIYAGEGEAVLTCQAFPKGKAYGVSAGAQGNVVLANVESYEIG